MSLGLNPALAYVAGALYGRAFGLADRENNVPVQLDTPFLFASQGKMFTAVAVLQLIHAGKINFDDPVGTYLTD